MNISRVKIVTAFFLVFLVFLLGRSLFLSLFSLDSDSIPQKKFPIYPSRGIIYDAKGIPLVSNSHKYFFYLDSSFFKRNVDEKKIDANLFFKQLEEIFGISEEYVNERLEKLPFILVGTSEAQKKELPVPLLYFISVDHSDERKILYPEMEQLLGKVDKYGGGINGFEKYFNSKLIPKQMGAVDYKQLGKYGRLGKIVNITDPVDGDNVSITIDLSFQQILSEELLAGVEEYSAKNGFGIILESKTGKVKAMFSSLGWNFPIMGVFEPGSALKPFIFAISEKYFLSDDEKLFNCTGKIKPFADLPTIINDTHIHGLINTKEALANSCNVATVEIALDFLKEMDEWTFYEEYKRFGFGQLSGIELPGEVEGIIHAPPDWNRLTGIQMAIGQGIAVTGIQLISAFNVFANNGIYLQPTLLNNKEDQKSQRLLSDEINRKLVDMMVGTVEYGTGKSAKISGLSIAAKTGTAQKAFPGEGYVKGKYYSSFIGFFPAENPAYTILISLDEPAGEIYYGGDVAAPVFRKIVENILEMLKKPEKETPEPILLKSWKMPDLSNLSRKDVIDVLNVLGFELSEISFEGKGIVYLQEPAAETPISSVSEIKVYLKESEGNS